MQRTAASGGRCTRSWPPQLLLGFDEAGTAANARTDGKGRRTDPQPLETAEIRLGSRVLLYRLLSAAGADPELVVGFREQDGKIIGRAWVLMDGKSLVEPESDLTRFSPVLRFGARGALLQEMRAGCEPQTLVR